MTMTVTLKRGSRGEAVRQVQKALNLLPDGIFGALTEERVKDFQRSKGLTPDGIVGARTLAALFPKAVAQAVTPSHSHAWGNRYDLKKSRRRIDYIAVHCTASPEGQAMTVADIRRIHKKNGWSDIGYHYVIDLDGIVYEGRDVDLSGAHVSGYNSHSIGVVYVGGLERDPRKPYNQQKGKDTRTEMQKAALLSLLMDLKKIYPKAVIQGHRDFSPDLNGNGIIEPSEWIKECPCFDAKTEYSKI